MKSILLILSVFILAGCESIKKCPIVPDSVNYTISRDRQDGALTDYFGASWNLK